MIIRQTRLRIAFIVVPGIVLFTVLGGLISWMTVDLLIRGQSVWLLTAVSAFFDAAGLVSAVGGGLMLARPACLSTSDQGFEVQYPLRKRSWRWHDVSAFRHQVGPHGSVVGVAFDERHASASRVVTLPGGWPFGVDGMIAFLNEAKAHFDSGRLTTD